jgi:hypothetical protein
MERATLAAVEAFVAAGGGFLLAVLWFDLMHDVQARGVRGAPVPDDALASIAGYYARVTTGARPMNRLVALAMLGTLAAIVVEIAAGLDPGWLPWTSLVLAAVPITIAGFRTVPAAIRLGRQIDEASEQGRLARAILREHLICVGFITALLILQLASAAR